MGGSSRVNLPPERYVTFKRSLYARHGVAEYWLVDTDTRTVEVLAPGGQDYERVARYAEGQRLTSPLLAGFSRSGSGQMSIPSGLRMRRAPL